MTSSMPGTSDMKNFLMVKQCIYLAGGVRSRAISRIIQEANLRGERGRRDGRFF